MRFAVDTWAPDYGVADQTGPAPDTSAPVEVDVEVSPSAWAPRTPPATSPPERILFIDGVRRTDARVWIDEGTSVRPGICASYAAGSVLVSAGSAHIDIALSERGLFVGPGPVEAIVTRHGRWEPFPLEDDSDEHLWLKVQERMGVLEAEVAAQARADLVVIDGPLHSASPVAGGVGYVKTHRRVYLPPEQQAVTAALDDGQRTPVFMIASAYPRASFYLRLPGRRAHPLAGVVRIEMPASLGLDELSARADQVAATLPRFASAHHRDPRAPQNLNPIAGLEARLRHRLGDPVLIERSLRTAAGSVGGPAHPAPDRLSPSTPRAG